MTDQERWQMRLSKSGYLIGAIVFHIILFLLLATYIVFRAPAPEVDASSFQPVSIKPTPPPTPPAPSGGETANNFEPATETAPPPSVASITTSIASSAFAIDATAVKLPNMPASMTQPTGTALAGHSTAGPSSGAGSPFGTSTSNGTAQLEGYLYDFKQTSDHRPTGMDVGAALNKIKEFVAGNWNPGILNHFYKSPKPLHTSSIFIPIIDAKDGPAAFGVENEVQPNMYCVWYKVTATPPQEGTYHFVGTGDDVLLVRVNHRTVLDGCDYLLLEEQRKKQKKINMTNFDPTFPNNADFWLSDSFHVGARDSVDIDILIGEMPGGKSDYFLFIQREESTYKTQENGSPLLPIFQVDTKPVQPQGKPRSYPPFSDMIEAWTPGTPGF